MIFWIQNFFIRYFCIPYWYFY